MVPTRSWKSWLLTTDLPEAWGQPCFSLSLSFLICILESVRLVPSKPLLGFGVSLQPPSLAWAQVL